MKKLIIISSLFLISSAIFSQGSYCYDARILCLGTSNVAYPGHIYAGSAESGPNYGCMLTQPNPAWFYFQIENPGEMEIKIMSWINTDIDFVCWGPFSGVGMGCNVQLSDSSKIVDCGYVSGGVEYCNIPDAEIGKYYYLLVTNYSNQTTDIVISQSNLSDSSATMFCSPGIWICPGDTLSLHSPCRDSSAWFRWTFPNYVSVFTQDIKVPIINNSYNGTLIHTIRTASDTLDFYYQIYVEPAAFANFTYTVLPSLCDSFINYCQNYEIVHWDFGDGDTSNSLSPVHCYASAGNYVVTLTAYGPCDSSVKTITINSALAIPEQPSTSVSIYPNPSTGLIHLNFAETKDSRVEVLNFCGQLIISKAINNQTQTTLDLTGHAKGMYFVKVQTGSGVLVRKVIVE